MFEDYSSPAQVYSYRIERENGRTFRFLKSLGNPLPNTFRAAAELVLSLDLKRTIEDPEGDPEEMHRLLEETGTLGIELDVRGLSYVLERAIEGLLEKLERQAEDLALLRRIESLVDLAHAEPFDVDLWQPQNRCYQMRQTIYPAMSRRAEDGDQDAREWVERFRVLADRLGVRVG